MSSSARRLLGCRVDKELAPCSTHASLRRVAAVARGVVLVLSGADRNVRARGRDLRSSEGCLCRYDTNDGRSRLGSGVARLREISCERRRREGMLPG